MKISRRLAFACAFCATSAARAQEAPARNTLTPAHSLDRLMEGNRRFVADAPAPPGDYATRRRALTRGQAPFAAILGCADSRTPPEALFRASLGEVFTVRIAGNSLFTDGLGSLEFAANALGVSVILVLGHERCGAVGAAIQVAEQGAQLPGALMSVVEPILPAVAEARRSNPANMLDATIKQHARLTARRLRDQPSALSPAIASGALRVEAAYYDLDKGRVTLLPA
ncbi:MAG: carbonic anhydrase [Roseococcus sp.]